MVVYEVNLGIERAIETDYRGWLHAHVAAILALPGFIDAEVFDVIDPMQAAERFALCVQYRLDGEDALATYLREHAPRMREDGLQRFCGRFEATRRILRPA